MHKFNIVEDDIFGAEHIQPRFVQAEQIGAHLLAHVQDRTGAGRHAGPGPGAITDSAGFLIGGINQQRHFLVPFGMLVNQFDPVGIFDVIEAQPHPGIIPEMGERVRAVG